MSVTKKPEWFEYPDVFVWSLTAAIVQRCEESLERIARFNGIELRIPMQKPDEIQDDLRGDILKLLTDAMALQRAEVAEYRRMALDAINTRPQVFIGNTSL